MGEIQLLIFQAHNLTRKNRGSDLPTRSRWGGDLAASEIIHFYQLHIFPALCGFVQTSRSHFCFPLQRGPKLVYSPDFWLVSPKNNG